VRAIVLLCLVSLLGCLSAPAVPPRPAPSQDAQGQDLAPEPPPCRPVVTGEPVFNEVLVRPGGFDFDGDGESNGHDEAIELIHDADYDAHYQGVQLWQAGKLRGTIQAAECVPPGQMIVLTGPGTRPLLPDPGVTHLRLDHALSLADSGGKLLLRGLAGTVLAEVALPPALEATPTSLARVRDGDRLAPLDWHCRVPEADDQPASIGRCLDGQPPCHCIEAQAPLCDREQPVRDDRKQ
jgi:hypothetical protein